MLDRNLLKLEGMHAVFGALAMLSLLQAACIMGQAASLAQAIALLWKAEPLESALSPILAFFACFTVLQLVRFAQETMLDVKARSVSENLRSRLLSHAFSSRFMLARSHGAAAVAAAANEGIDQIESYLRIIPPKTMGLAAISLPLLVCEFVVDWPSGIILAVMFPVIVFFMVLLGRQASARSKRQYARYTQLGNRFLDTLRGLPTIDAFDAVSAESDMVFTSSERLRRATVSTLRTATLSSVVLDLCATFGIAAVAMMLAFRLMDASIPLQLALLALIVAPEYFAPIRSFAGDYHASLDGKNALAAVLDMIGADDDSQAEDLPACTELAFENVSFLYDSNAGVHEVTFTLHEGERIAIVGPSGSGKSTLASLVAGFHAPLSGTIRVNGRAACLNTAAWQRQVRYIPQNPYIFSASLLDNVRFYNPQATREEALEAIRAVGLSPLVTRLPEGIDTLVGDGGRGLSGGEAHRVALARILIDGKSRILVFDEPTAHLDIETELELKPYLLEAMRGKTVVFATHRHHWLGDVDRIISLEGGRIVGSEVVA